MQSAVKTRKTRKTMISLKINDKEYEVPVSFDEITLGDYCRCFTGLEKTDGLEGGELFYATRKNEAVVLSRLLSEDDSFAYSLPLPLYASLVDVCSFIYSIDGIKPSDFIEVDGRKYQAPEPNQMNLRQWIDIDMTMHDENIDEGQKFIELLSMIMLPLDDKGEMIPYGGQDKEMPDKLRKLKASDALGTVHRFFLRGAISSRLTEVLSRVERMTDRSRLNTQGS